jgi:hypothetical protein
MGGRPEGNEAKPIVLNMVAPKNYENNVQIVQIVQKVQSTMTKVEPLMVSEAEPLLPEQVCFAKKNFKNKLTKRTKDTKHTWLNFISHCFLYS